MEPDKQYKISTKQLAEEHGYEDVSEFLTNECQDSIVPACCSEGCETEPDGNCEHGCPSVLIALKLI